jgi:hypothetical protein
MRGVQKAVQNVICLRSADAHPGPATVGVDVNCNDHCNRHAAAITFIDPQIHRRLRKAHAFPVDLGTELFTASG